MGAIKEMIDAGHVRHIGLSEVDAATIRRAHAVLLGVAGALLPALMRRALTASGEGRETQPLVNVAASLLVAALLALLSYAVCRPVVALSPSAATHAVPAALSVVLIGFFVLVTRRRALSQVVGFLLIDNGITAIAFLTTSGIPLIVELGVSLDVLLVVLVLQVLTTRIRAAFGGSDGSRWPAPPTRPPGTAAS